MPEEKEIQQLIEKAEIRLKAAEYLFKKGFYEDSAGLITACILQLQRFF